MRFSGVFCVADAVDGRISLLEGCCFQLDEVVVCFIMF